MRLVRPVTCTTAHTPDHMSCSSKAHNHLHDALPHGKPNIFFTQLCRTLTMSLELRPMMMGGHSGRSPASAFISGYIATKLAYK